MTASGRWVSDDNVSLVTDFYELTMAQGYFARDMTYEATFELFVRSLPGPRRFLVAAGLDDALGILEAFRFGPDVLDYLTSLERFDDDFLHRLGGVRFTGDVWAMREGEVAFHGEPLVRVTAPLPEAQLVETALLSTIGFQTMIASKAARIDIAAADASFVDFSPRRDHGPGAALMAARAAYVGGAAGTSMTLAGMVYGIPVTGTMAHSYVMSFGEEIEAFRAFARSFPDDTVLLIDTYDTEEGARLAARVADEVAANGIEIRGVRLDSGDLQRLSKSVRAILDDAGHPEIQIFASGDLDEYRIHEMTAAGSPVNAFGVGTRLGTSVDAPYLGVVYKLVHDAHGPKMKLSAEKATLPGPKQVFRVGDDAVGRVSHDILALPDEDVPGRPLLVEAMRAGERTLEQEPLETARDRRAAAVAALPSRLRTLTGRERPYQVQRSPGLQRLVEETLADLED